MITRAIKPSYLVSLKSTVTGGISYKRIDLDRANAENGTEVAKWETTRTIDDKEDYEKAVKVRGKAINEIRRVCHASSFGLLCPLDKETELDEAIAEANKTISEYNAGSLYSRVNIYILKGQISNTDSEAIRALSAEVASLIVEMENGINKLDANEIRVAANKAKQLAGTLEDEQSAMLTDAIAEARKAARMFVKRVEKKGEKAEVVLAEVKRNDLEKARVAFLDYSEEEQEEEVETLPIAQPQRFADLDISESPEGV